jgi:hypothetical protein
MPEKSKSRFDAYKARHNGGPGSNAQCNIEALLDRLHDKIHDALDEFDSVPERDQRWHQINSNAQKLIDDMPPRGIDSVLTLFAFLLALDNPDPKSA